MELPTDPRFAVPVLRDALVALTERVEALETGRNIEYKPEFDQGAAEDDTPTIATVEVILRQLADLMETPEQMAKLALRAHEPLTGCLAYEHSCCEPGLRRSLPREARDVTRCVALAQREPRCLPEGSGLR